MLQHVRDDVQRPTRDGSGRAEASQALRTLPRKRQPRAPLRGGVDAWFSDPRYGHEKNGKKTASSNCGERAVAGGAALAASAVFLRLRYAAEYARLASFFVALRGVSGAAVGAAEVRWRFQNTFCWLKKYELSSAHN